MRVGHQVVTQVEVEMKGSDVEEVMKYWFERYGTEEEVVVLDMAEENAEIATMAVQVVGEMQEVELLVASVVFVVATVFVVASVHAEVVNYTMLFAVILYLDELVSALMDAYYDDTDAAEYMVAWLKKTQTRKMFQCCHHFFDAESQTPIRLCPPFCSELQCDLLS